MKIIDLLNDVERFIDTLSLSEYEKYRLLNYINRIVIHLLRGNK